MRTTLVLDSRLYRRAKELAAAQGVTLSDIVNDALRVAFAQPSSPTPTGRFEMITYGQGLPEIHREPEELAAAIDSEDRSTLAR